MRTEILIQLRIEHEFDSKLLDTEWKDHETYRELLFNGSDLASIKYIFHLHYTDEYIAMIEELNAFNDLIDTMIHEVKSVLGLESVYANPEALYARLFIIRVKSLKKDSSPVQYRLRKGDNSKQQRE